MDVIAQPHGGETRRSFMLKDGKLHLAVLGSRGGVHFWVAAVPDAPTPGFVGYHVRAEDGDPCPVTGAPCRHEYDADDVKTRDAWVEVFAECNGAHDLERFWSALEAAYAERFK